MHHQTCDLVCVVSGCSRALLCRLDDQGQLLVKQVTTDHDLRNEAELDRLRQAGVDVDHVCKVGKVGSIQYTRTIGDRREKVEFKDIDGLK